MYSNKVHIVNPMSYQGIQVSKGGGGGGGGDAIRFWPDTKVGGGGGT